MNSMVSYRGYDGSVEYSAEDQMLHGRVLGIRGMISYGGSSVRAIKKNFRDAVDEYLEFCEKRGKTPNTPFKGSFNVRVSPDLHQKASLYADKHEMKLNAVVTKALSDLLTHAG